MMGTDFIVIKITMKSQSVVTSSLVMKHLSSTSIFQSMFEEHGMLFGILQKRILGPSNF